nr:hypothetical protein [Providencia rettgeri]
MANTRIAIIMPKYDLFHSPRPPYYGLHPSVFLIACFNE